MLGGLAKRAEVKVCESSVGDVGELSELWNVLYRWCRVVFGRVRNEDGWCACVVCHGDKRFHVLYAPVGEGETL